MASKKMLSKHFSYDEFRCKCGCGTLNVHPQLIRTLEQLRAVYGDVPIKVTSGCRCRKHNSKPVKDGGAGGAPDSQHIADKTRPCRAADIKIKGLAAKQIADRIRGWQPYADRYNENLMAIKGVGLYKKYPNLIHVDVREGKFTEWTH